MRDQLGAERGEDRREVAGGVARADRRAKLARHRAGVEAFLHAHEVDAGLGVAGHDRALHRRRAAPARQQRSVNVEAAELRRGEHGRRQDEPIGGDDRDIRREAAELVLRFEGAQRRGRHDGQRQGLGEPMNRRLGDFEPAPARRLRRARVDGDDVVALLEDGPQGRRREFGGAHEDDTHGGAHNIARSKRQKTRRLFARRGAAVYFRPIRQCADRRRRTTSPMTTPTPSQDLDLRVYYEDTDFSGRVYHASYLRFMERGRTEWLRALGFEHGALAGEQGLVFAVRWLEIEYLAPAVIDDLSARRNAPRAEFAAR